jgi:hypothetical protein
MSEPTLTVSVDLTDEELTVLNGRCSPKVQVQVDAAVLRLVFVSRFPDLTTAQARLVADAVSEAGASGLLILQHQRIRHCSLCGKSAGYYHFKSGRRKGKPDYDRPLSMNGYELARRSLYVQGYAAMGGCTGCLDPVLPVLAEELRGVRAQLPDSLRVEGEPRWIRYDRRQCKKCGWVGHEGRMRWRLTMMGDGYFPGGCPECDAGSGLFEHDIDFLTGEFDVVEYGSEEDGNPGHRPRQVPPEIAL